MVGWRRLQYPHHFFFFNLLLLNTTCPVLANSVDLDQLASEEANWSGSALFAIQYLNLYEQLGSSNTIGCKLEVGQAFSWSYKNELSEDNAAHQKGVIRYVCLCWGFTAQSTQWGHVERSQFT